MPILSSSLCVWLLLVVAGNRSVGLPAAAGKIHLGNDRTQKHWKVGVGTGTPIPISLFFAFALGFLVLKCHFA